MRFAAPLEHTKEAELDVRVRIGVALREPRRCARDFDPELFIELAHERVVHRLAGLALATREFPITGVGRAGQPLRQQHTAVAAQQNRDRDLDDRPTAQCPLALFKACAPACARANCQATRPLRDPRCRAN